MKKKPLFSLSEQYKIKKYRLMEGGGKGIHNDDLTDLLEIVRLEEALDYIEEASEADHCIKKLNSLANKHGLKYTV